MKKKVILVIVLLAAMMFMITSCGKKNAVGPDNANLPEMNLPSSFGHQVVPESTRTVEPVDTVKPPVLAKWDPSGYQLAIIREAKYALSRRMDGTSSQILYYGAGAYFGGDWDYVGSNAWAREVVGQHYGWNWSYIGNTGAWPEYNLTRNWRNVGHGGGCKFFADLVQWRATGGAKGFLPPNAEATGDIRYAEPGDIIQRNDYSPHTAIIISIISRDATGKPTAVDVIDSNYIGGGGRYIIARHPISGSELEKYRTYH